MIGRGIATLVVAVLLTGCGLTVEAPSWEHMTDEEREAYCANVQQQYEGIDRRWGNAFQLNLRLERRLAQCRAGGYLP